MKKDNNDLLVRKAITPPEMIPTDITTNPKQNPTINKFQ